MKKIILVACVIVCLCLAIIFLQHRKIGFLKNDLNELFGENKYVIENVDDKHITFYAINDNYQGFDILINFMKDSGYKHVPNLQLGALHFFENSNGEKVSCEVTNRRTIVICDLYFE